MTRPFTQTSRLTGINSHVGNSASLADMTEGASWWFNSRHGVTLCSLLRQAAITQPARLFSKTPSALGITYTIHSPLKSFDFFNSNECYYQSFTMSQGSGSTQVAPSHAHVCTFSHAESLGDALTQEEKIGREHKPIQKKGRIKLFQPDGENRAGFCNI